MNLLGTSPLTRIDLSVWWTDVNGIFWPIRLFFNEEITIKLLFVKKLRSDLKIIFSLQYKSRERIKMVQTSSDDYSKILEETDEEVLT